MISVVINTLNEERNLPRALTSIKNFADEIIVTDMHSEDRTREIAESSGAKVYLLERTRYVEPARNFAISKASNDWILVLDADEEVSKTLTGKLEKICKEKNSADYYRMPRKNIIFGKWIRHSRWWPDYNIRFFRKGHVSFGEIIHSVPTTKGKGLDLEAKEENAIVHYHYQSVEEFVERMNRYTSEHAKLLIKDGYRFKWRDLLKKPTNEFLSRYFQGEGYKDGVHGLALAGLQALSEFVMYLKLWQTDGFKEKDIELTQLARLIKENQKEVNYWVADSLLNERGGFVQRIKRKFRLP